MAKQEEMNPYIGREALIGKFRDDTVLAIAGNFFVDFFHLKLVTV